MIDPFFAAFALATIIAVVILWRVVRRSRSAWKLAKKKRRLSAPFLKVIWMIVAAIIFNFCFWPFIFLIGPKLFPAFSHTETYRAILVTVISAAEIGLAVLVAHLWNNLEKGNDRR
jgi:Na+-driven multidrug efflux pump